MIEINGDMQMKPIIINALQYKYNSSGIGVMIRDLFGMFSFCYPQNIKLLLPKNSPSFPAADGTEKITIPYSYQQKLRRVLYQLFVAGPKYCGNSVLLTTDSKVPFFLPKTCTLVPLITDLGIYCIPQAYQFSRVVLWKLQFRYLLHRADFFIAVSEYTKKEMIRILNIPADKIDVIPCACGENMHRITDEKTLETLRKKYQLSEQYLLFVGSNNPRKNLQRLIRAYDIAREHGLQNELVIAGEIGWKFSKEEVLKDIRFKDSIHFIGFVPDEDMPALYSAAKCFVFPTLYEGFGIPVIEAQKCGTPVLTSKQSSLPEVGGDGAVYVDAYDIQDIAEGMLQIMQKTDLTELVDKGYQNAEKYSWKKSAEMLSEVLLNRNYKNIKNEEMG